MSGDFPISAEDIARLTELLNPKPGDLFMIRYPAGLTGEEQRSLAHWAQAALRSYGAGALLVPVGVTIERTSPELLDAARWLLDRERGG